MKKLCIVVLLPLLALACSNGPKKSAETLADVQEEQIETQDVQIDYSVSKDMLVIEDVTLEDGVRKISTSPSDICPSQIDVEVKDGIIKSVKFWGGCPGNTQAVSKLVLGMKVENAIAKLRGIDCGGKGTSCPDQLSKTLMLFVK